MEKEGVDQLAVVSQDGLIHNVIGYREIISACQTRLLTVLHREKTLFVKNGLVSGYHLVCHGRSLCSPDVDRHSLNSADTHWRY